MAPREPRKTGMSKAIDPTCNLWLGTEARRSIGHRQFDLDVVEPIAPSKVEHGAQAVAGVSWRVRVTTA